ncbi:MAG: type II secretion system F family protein [Proteobacteria bacterium]|nr:type II secretion system F family protein [Pseudomonadota bacterium]
MATKLNRREFLKAAAFTPFAIDWPAWMPRLAFAPKQTNSRGDTLVVIFLRGAADAINMVVPYGEDSYYQARPTLGIPRPDDSRADADQRAIDLDGFFGLHPIMKALMPAWQDEQLAIVHACGAPDESRSHFKAMELMERGVSDEQGPASGWIGRHLSSHDTGNHSPLRAIGIGKRAPLSLQGTVPVTALRSIIDFHLGGDANAAKQMQAALQTLYGGEDEISKVGQETLEMLDTLEALDPATYESSGEPPYPTSEYGDGLRQVAMLIKAEVARFCRTLGTLIGNGVGMLSALSLAGDTITNAALARDIETVAGSLKEGKSLTEPLADSDLFPRLALHLTRVGEETGKMEEMLLKVADIYDKDVQRTLDRALALLVPVFTIVLGVIIAGIIGSILAAILSVYELPI